MQDTSFQVIDDQFYLNGKKVFLNSGEIHYFRIKRENWDIHLQAAREAGLMAVSSYVPWAWHESTEGVFDFNGKSCPERDLEGWINRCKAHGLYCILKPGPFILAEFRGAGLPDWFLEKHGTTVKMRTSRNEAVNSDGVNLFHPIYLEKVGLWYDQIMPLISRNQIQYGGPVIMMQICNEIGVFSWLAHQADYGEGVRERFIAYIISKFKDIRTVNTLWGTDYADFINIGLPPDGRLPYASKFERSMDYEWHCFWRTYYAEYLKMLTAMARDRGVTIPVYHNLPGWIYGSGYEFPVNITMYEELFGQKSEILFGVDHIPEFMSYRNMHDDRIINDITLAMQGNKPLFAAEFQCGSREFHVVTNPAELELFYKTSLINGLRGWNYYMFSQGRNPQHTGYSGETFYWFNPLNPEGERSSAFPLVQRMSNMLNVSSDLLLETQRKAEVAVLFYPPYYATELEHPLSEACDLRFNPSGIRRPAFFDGVLKALQVLNVDYDMHDLTQSSPADLSAYSQVWAFCTDEMNAGDQQTLVDAAIQGCQLVIFPYLPDREMSQKPCTILRDCLNLSPDFEYIDSPLMHIFDYQDIKCQNPLVIYPESSFESPEIIARTLNGNVCGFIRKTGKGSIVHLGTWIGFDTEGHIPVYEALLSLSGARLRQANSSNLMVNIRQRFNEKGSGMVFIGNFYNEDHQARLWYTHPATGEEITLPVSGGTLNWPGLYSIVSPVCLELAPGLRLLHCTSDIVGLTVDDHSIELRLYGHRDLQGELVLEGPACARIHSVSCRNQALEAEFPGNRNCYHYNHLHQEEFNLKITLQ